MKKEERKGQKSDQGIAMNVSQPTASLRKWEQGLIYLEIKRPLLACRDRLPELYMNIYKADCSKLMMIFYLMIITKL
jgi:hypothetical protein